MRESFEACRTTKEGPQFVQADAGKDAHPVSNYAFTARETASQRHILRRMRVSLLFLGASSRSDNT